MESNGMPFHPLWIVPLFLVFGGSLWLAITSFLGAISGWFRLQKIYPDSGEPAIVHMPMQSGAMGTGLPSSFGNSLTIDACGSGLRLAVIRLLGPFQRPILVPWSQVSVRRIGGLFGDFYEFSFGTPRVGKLLLRRPTTERIAAAGFIQMPQ